MAREHMQSGVINAAKVPPAREAISANHSHASRWAKSLYMVAIAPNAVLSQRTPEDWVERSHSRFLASAFHLIRISHAPLAPYSLSCRILGFVGGLEFDDPGIEVSPCIKLFF
jgi:hypothetical protein